MAINPRSDLEFEVVLSIHIEKMMWTLLGRIDRLFSFLQIFMGVAVVTQFAPTLVGLVVAGIAAAQLVWQPGIKATEAKASHDRWHNLLKQFGRMKDDAIQKEVSQLSERDSQALRCLHPAAHVSAAIQLGRDTSDAPAMQNWQKVLVFFAGG